jgi:hypothetical protein
MPRSLFERGSPGPSNKSCAPVASRWSIVDCTGVQRAEIGLALVWIGGELDGPAATSGMPTSGLTDDAGDAPALGWSSSHNDDLRRGVCVGAETKRANGREPTVGEPGLVNGESREVDPSQAGVWPTCCATTTWSLAEISNVGDGVEARLGRGATGRYFPCELPGTRV